MANKKVVKETGESLKTIEEWQKLEKTDTSIFEGMKCHKGWKKGMAVDETAYKGAVSEFLKAPLRKVK